MPEDTKSFVGRKGMATSCHPLFWVLVALIYGGLAYGAALLTTQSGRIEPFWVGNGLLVGFLLFRDRQCKIGVLTLCLIAICVANLLVGDSRAVAFAFACGNVIEIALAVFLIERWFGRSSILETLRQFAGLMLVGTFVPILAGLIPAAALALESGATLASTLIQWGLAHSIPIPIFASLVLICRERLSFPERSSRPLERNWALVVATLAVAIPTIFVQETFPFLFLASPVVILAAFLVGRLGTALVVAVFAIAAIMATLQGTGPIALVGGGVREEAIALQIFLLSSLAIGLPVALALGRRDAMLHQLAESETRFRKLADAAPIGIFQADQEGEITYVNSHWLRRMGLEPDAMLGGGWKAALATGEEYEDDPAFSGFNKPGDVRRRVVRFKGLDGHEFWVETTNSAEFDEHGRISGFVGVAQDITDQRQALDRVIASEMRFQSLADMAPAGIFRTSKEGGCTYVNEAWKRLSGLVDGEWEGSGWQSAVHPDDITRVTAKWRDCVSREAGSEDEFRWQRPDGSIVWVNVVYGPERDSRGDVSGFIGVVSDVTERVVAQKKLAEREEQLALLADNATDAVLKLDLEGFCTYASPSARQIFGIDPRSMVGNQFITGFLNEDRAIVEKRFEELVTGKCEQTRIAFRSLSLVEDGVYHWLEANCGLVRDPVSGKPKEIIASLRNIDENKQLEAEMIEAKERAEAAAEAKSTFLANMSHEIRTPMNGVLGFAELALAGDLPEDQRANLQMIADSGSAMLTLLNDLLDFAKIEAGQMSVSAEPTDLHHLISGAMRIMEPVAAQKGLAMELSVADGIPRWIKSDPLRLRQIILNLIGNALKFTAEGWVKIEVGADYDSSELEIAVIDSGIGIPEDKIDHIFESFTQADPTTARQFGGTGLGLPISAQLAKLLGGRLTAESNPDAGSTFRLRLGLEECLPPEDQESEGINPALTNGAVGLRILVAEDNLINQKLTLAMLEKAGHFATLAEDGVVAVEMVRERAGTADAFHLVLMDVQMPRLDGLQAARLLREEGYSAEELPIIAVTANAYQEDIEACLQAGMQAHLAKPLRQAELEDAITRWGSKPCPTSDRIDA